MTKKTILTIISLLLLCVLNAQTYEWTEVLKITGNDVNEHLGANVDMDGNYAVISSVDSDNPRVYVYHYNSTTWNQVAVLTCTDETRTFGSSVAISGNYIVVGDINEDNYAEHRITYVFVKPENGWTDMTETAKLEASDNYNFNFFGYSVDIDGDCIVVGAYGDYNGSCKGSAYVFVKPESGWADMTETAKLTASDGVDSDYFGGTVSVSGNCIAIGAPGNDVSGSVYIFEKPENGWVSMNETTKLTPLQSYPYADFGISVFISDNYLAVGSQNYDSGAAFVFEKQGEDWSTAVQVAKLSSSNVNSNNYFGRYVSFSEDRVFVGAPGNYSCEGRVYIFDKPADGWTNMLENYEIAASDSINGNYFGGSVSVVGDHMIVGAYTDEFNGDWKGSAYFFNYPDVSYQHEFTVNDIAIYPNPAKEIINIRSGESTDVILQVINMNGDVVLETPVNLSHAEINIKNLPEGTYVVKMSSGDKVYQKKLVKLK